MTLVEVIVVMGIVMMLIALLGFILGPIIKERGTQPICAANMRTIAAGYRLYMADHDDAPPRYDSTLIEIRRYFPPVQCPKAPMFMGARSQTYYELHALHWRQAQEIATLGPSLPNGLIAPKYDIETDSLVQCSQHGIEGFGKNSYSVVGLHYDVPNLRGRILTAYLDGRVAYRPMVPCWMMPFEVAHNAFYRNHPELITHCDGQLQRKP